MAAKWNTGKPPNEKLVEVDLDGEIIRVKAYFGRDGYLPHWRSEDETRSWRVSAFREWREIKTDAAEELERSRTVFLSIIVEACKRYGVVVEADDDMEEIDGVQCYVFRGPKNEHGSAWLIEMDDIECAFRNLGP